MFESIRPQGAPAERPDDPTLDRREGRPEEWTDEFPDLSPGEMSAAGDEAALDWVSIERELRHGVEQSFGTIHPSGFLALEMDTDTRAVVQLDDAELVDAMVGWERLTSWAQARQARVLAEFARRRPGEDTTMVNTDKPCSLSRFAPSPDTPTTPPPCRTTRTRRRSEIEVRRAPPQRTGTRAHRGVTTIVHERPPR
ncbi:MAG TPA: hypothetical protein VD903_16930 [Pseudonocardia sp.]|nr:hypothetical protein [Pseudonocardia sp.]